MANKIIMMVLPVILSVLVLLSADSLAVNPGLKIRITQYGLDYGRWTCYYFREIFKPNNVPK